MKLMPTYAVKISRSADIRSTLSATAGIYRRAVDFFIRVMIEKGKRPPEGGFSFCQEALRSSIYTRKYEMYGEKEGGKYGLKKYHHQRNVVY